ncbi:MAG: manganese efflux pump [Lachnospiraceae bacterium]|nr:manganese efflux pump [Lachnospiraceae bacterium]
MITLQIIIESIALGVGLAMDAFSVSLANGLRDPDMNKKNRFRIAGCFSFFQFLMPVAGWILVHTLLSVFNALEPLIPWIAFILLAFIGGKMLLEGIRKEGKKDAADDCEKKEKNNGFSGPATSVLILQGIATSIDALSAGITMAGYGFLQVFVSALIIAALTLIICLAGIAIGRRFGMRFSSQATVLGGVILIGIGLHVILPVLPGMIAG